MSEFSGKPDFRQQHAQMTELQMLTPASARPNTSDDIERLLSSSFYPGASPEYSRHAPTPSNSTGSTEDAVEFLSYAQHTVHSQQDTEYTTTIKNKNDTDTNIKNKKKSNTGTKRKADTEDNGEPGEVTMTLFLFTNPPA
ncbi:hypothetical protein NQ176_g11010 [Zarea fungicola]|uniref:Uncharacterized protein n=1 Tax=Zarea fungicola TaxID=93591 RepID=A0ACC1MDL6_9HYPO|nr:hypothetical protein NQ176_g11010 [Lecanicillium fungicola]